MPDVFNALYAQIIMPIMAGEHKFTEEIIANVGLAMDYYIPRLPDASILQNLPSFQTLFLQVVRIAG